MLFKDAWCNQPAPFPRDATRNANYGSKRKARILIERERERHIGLVDERF